MKTYQENLEVLQPLTVFDELLHTVALTAHKTVQAIAQHTLSNYPLNPSEFAVACIDVSNRSLEYIADLVTGKQDWEVQRSEINNPIAIGAVFWSFCESAANAVPYKKEEIEKIPEEGKVKLLVIGVTGIAVYEIIPQAFETPAQQ